jgi:polyferredoxin
MKEKISYIVTISIAILTAIFTILKEQVWSGFVYFVFASLMVLALFWCGWLIYKYFTDFTGEFAERYKFFRAEKINSLKITSDIYDANEEVYKKEFKKKLFRDKLVKWFIICLCFAIAVMFLIALILY